MIKTIKEKTEMRGSSPFKVLTVEIDLESVQQDSKDISLEGYQSHATIKADMAI